MKKRLLRYAFLVSAVGLGLGTASVAGASSGSIDTTGPGSNNEITATTRSDIKVRNDNYAIVTNYNTQTAKTGSAEVEHNTTGGDATSGAASNSNALDVSYTVNNSGTSLADPSNCGCSGDASISTTGPGSNNEVEFKNTSTIDVKNDNDLTVTNYNTQTAKTGSAEVEHNTTGGDATSGDAANANTTTVMMDITN